MLMDYKNVFINSPTVTTKSKKAHFIGVYFVFLSITTRKQRSVIRVEGFCIVHITNTYLHLNDINNLTFKNTVQQT